MKHTYFNMHNLPQKCDTLWSAEKWSSPLYVMMRTSTDFLNNRLNHTAKKRRRRTQKSHQKWIVKRVQMLKKHVELRNKYEKNTSNVRKIRISVWRQFFVWKKKKKTCWGKNIVLKKHAGGKALLGKKTLSSLSSDLLCNSLCELEGGHQFILEHIPVEEEAEDGAVVANHRRP